MIDFIKSLAVVAIVLSGALVITAPLAIGKDRGVYRYSNFIANLVEFLILLLMGLRIFGKI